jgi:transcriptional regulator with XRE-family HTH domain
MIIDTESPISERLAQARQRLKMKIDDVCARMPSRPSTSKYHAWERGRAMPKIPTILELAAALEVAPGYLMGITNDYRTNLDSGYPCLEGTSVINAEGAAVRIATDKNAAFSAFYFEQLGLTPERCILVKATDSSMSPTLSKNDLALIDHSNKTPRERDLYALLVDNRIWFRWLEPELDGSIKVINHDGREVVAKDESLVIIGRVTAILHSR